VSEPLELRFEVACSPEHAFEVWTARFSQWWPRGHSRSGASDVTVVLEPRTGGRIYERTPHGDELDWGEVLEFEPPHRLRYLWHIYGERGDATEVEVSFAAAGEATAVTIVHSGFERLGAGGDELRRRNVQGWAGLLPHFERAASGG
jgi:uncharacterized protein YndB with AHSA1/START domain